MPSNQYKNRVAQPWTLVAGVFQLQLIPICVEIQPPPLRQQHLNTGAPPNSTIASAQEEMPQSLRLRLISVFTEIRQGPAASWLAFLLFMLYSLSRFQGPSLDPSRSTQRILKSNASHAKAEAREKLQLSNCRQELLSYRAPVSSQSAPSGVMSPCLLPVGTQWSEGVWTEA